MCQVTEFLSSLPHQGAFEILYQQSHEVFAQAFRGLTTTFKDEVYDNQLWVVAVIPPNVGFEEALTALERFDTAWWHERQDHSQGVLHFGIKFANLET